MSATEPRRGHDAGAAAHLPSPLPQYRYKTARDKHQTGPTTVVLEQGVWDGEAKKKKKREKKKAIY